MPTPPNIVLIMSDQHNAKCLGIAGHDLVSTPHLDGLARRGVYLTSAYTQNPICTPSRMCHLSGQYAHNHGYYGLCGPPPQTLPSLFSELEGQGYHTGAIGKIHTPSGWLEPHVHFYGSPAQGGAWQRESGSPHTQPLDDYPSFVARQQSGLAPWQVEQKAFLKSLKPQGYDGFYDYLPKEGSFEGYCANMVRQFLGEHPKDRPFFLWFTLPKPHQEYKPAREFWEMYPDEIPLPPSADDDGETKIWPLRDTLRDARCNPPSQSAPHDYQSLRQRKLHGYYGNISHMDWAVGQLLEALDAAGLRDDTLIIYTSDHGEFACEHGLLEKAPGIASDAVGRIPMIWSWPGHLPEGEVRDGLVESIDIWPTAASIAGLPSLETWDGRDITPLLRGGSTVHQAAFTENPWLKCITTTQWRLTAVPSGVFPDDLIRGELYDRLNDPWERTNLYHDPRFAPVVQDLREQLYDWLVTTTRPQTAHPLPCSESTLDLGLSGGKVAPQRMREMMDERQRHHLNYL